MSFREISHFKGNSSKANSADSEKRREAYLINVKRVTILFVGLIYKPGVRKLTLFHGLGAVGITRVDLSQYGVLHINIKARLF